MDLQAYRKSRGLTQEQVADELGLQAKSLVSMIETGERSATVVLALKIHRWSGGEVKAWDVCPDEAELLRATVGEAIEAQP